MKQETLCRTCRFLTWCDLLMEKGGGFSFELLSLDERPRECGRWEPTGYRQALTRLANLESFGLGALEEWLSTF
jgi:hypothetical protein